MTITGRTNEISSLKEVLGSSEAEFIAIYGRRRIGKTYLISEFFKDKGLYFELTGRKGATKSEQLRNFSMVFSDLFLTGKPHPSPKHWDEALAQLRHQIEALDAEQKVILFFDELPWLASRKSGFLQALDLFWNRYMSRRPNTILVICGSAAEWMVKKVILNKGGLHNRQTRPAINLMPFTLNESKEFLANRGIEFDNKQLAELYMAIGGVPYYLKMIPRGLSVDQILQTLFFSNPAPLKSEFNRLFDSLFENSQLYSDVVKALSTAHQGLTQQEIFAKVPSISSGGSAVEMLEALESCGFILKLIQFGNKKKDARYRLIDALSLFYLKWVGGTGEVSDLYWVRQQSQQAYNIWSGYAFENLCLQHFSKILEALKISVVAENKSCWYLPGTEKEKGAQIDLVIDRADNCINLVEMKFYDDTFLIEKTYSSSLEHKKNAFRRHSKTRKTLFTTLLTPYGAKQNGQYFKAVDNEITLDELFL